MSAYIVSRPHLATIVEYAAEVLQMRHLFKDDGSKARFANMLADENAASVNHLYGERVTPAHFTDAEVAQLAQRDYLQPLPILRAIGCLTYQSCEHDGWERSVAFHFLNEVRTWTVTHLPGYNDFSGHIDGGACPPGQQVRMRGQNESLRRRNAELLREAAGKVRH